MGSRGRGRSPCLPHIITTICTVRRRAVSPAAQIIKKREQMLIPSGVDRHFPVLPRQHIGFLNKREGGWGSGGKVYHVALIIHAYQRPQLLDSLSRETALLNPHSASASRQAQELRASPSARLRRARTICNLSHQEMKSSPLSVGANQRRAPESSFTCRWRSEMRVATIKREMDLL